MGSVRGGRLGIGKKGERLNVNTQHKTRETLILFLKCSRNFRFLLRVKAHVLCETGAT